MKILTWNIGSFVFERFFHCLSDDARAHEYYQPARNATFVSDTITAIAPSIVFLQEFYYREDMCTIPTLATFPFHYIIDTWYRSESALVASHTPLDLLTLAGGGSFDANRKSNTRPYTPSFVLFTDTRSTN